MAHPRWLLLGVALLGLLSGCGSEPPHILYEQDAQSLDNPFPDARLFTDQGLTLRTNWYQPFLAPKSLNGTMRGFLAQYTAQAQGLKGFGNFSPTLLRFSEPIDPATLTGVASRLLQTDQGFTVLERDVAIEHSGVWSVEAKKEVPADHPEFALVRPGVIAPEGSRGALVLRKGILTKAGKPLGRGRGFSQGSQAAKLVSDAAKALEIPEDEVLLVLPFQTEQVTGTFASLAGYAAQAAPSVTIPGRAATASATGGTKPTGVWRATDPDWSTSPMQTWLTRRAFGNPSSDVGAVVLGTFRTKDLRQDGIWKKELVDAPASAPNVDLDFTLTLPTGAKPAGGYRVVIGLHGINGRNTLRNGDNNSFCMEMAQLLANRGLGCLGIDIAAHGWRGSLTDFFALENLPRLRDNFRQTVFDLMQLAKMAQTLDFDADGAADLHPDLGYFGNSLGAIIGASFVAYDSPVKYALLNVPGGGLANILVSPDIQAKVGLLLVLKTGLTFQSADYYAAFPLFRALGQLFLDSGDPINLAQNFSGNKAVLIQEGFRDLTIPNFTTEDLSRVMKVEAATAGRTDAAGVKALIRVDPSRYGQPADYNGHNVFFDIPQVRTQGLTFLQTGGTQLVVE